MLPGKRGNVVQICLPVYPHLFKMWTYAEAPRLDHQAMSGESYVCVLKMRARTYA